MAGFGSATMPRHLVQSELDTGAQVRIHPEVWLKEDYLIYMDVIFPRDRTQGPAAEAFVDALRDSGTQ